MLNYSRNVRLYEFFKSLGLSIAVILSVFLAVSAYAQEPNIQGYPRVIDGDSLSFGKTRIRLQGIDAPETRQTCSRPDGSLYRCGKFATAVLVTKIGTQKVICKSEGKDD